MRLLLTLALLLLALPAQAQTVLELGGASAGGNSSASASYSLVGTVGQLQPVGVSTGADEVFAGLWHMLSEDTDGDGWPDAVDCDPNDATISPSATEIPNDGIDQDCDGSDSSDCFADTDGDGFGSTSVIASADTDCLDAGESDVDTDCDDSDPNAYPGATETCDAVDSNCDGDLVDGDADLDGDGLPDCADDDLDGDGVDNDSDCEPADPTIYAGAIDQPDDGIDQDCSGADTVSCWVDPDGDGWGAGNLTLHEATCPAGMAPVDGDCDEQNPAINPGAAEVCNGLVDDDCDPTTDEHDDADGDTWTICDGDCADDDALTHPGAVELCDSVDNDCDVTTGEDETDADSDGSRVCDGDCDDADAMVFPGAPELCDGIDNDCDGAPETNAEVESFLWYLDADGDGFGDMDAPHPDGLDCDQPESGYVVADTDCDDTDPLVHPDAEEICNGIDDDCDPDTDLDGTDLDADGDTYRPCDEDCDDTDPSLGPDAVEICDDGIDNDCNSLTDRDDAVCSGAGCTGCSAATIAGTASPVAGLLLLALGLRRRRPGARP